MQTDGTLACWGDTREGRASPPEGTFTQVSAGLGNGCGVRTDGTVACWGHGFDPGVTTLPGGTFTQVSLGKGFLLCGVQTDGTVACFGDGQATFRRRQPLPR